MTFDLFSETEVIYEKLEQATTFPDETWWTGSHMISRSVVIWYCKTDLSSKDYNSRRAYHDGTQHDGSQHPLHLGHKSERKKLGLLIKVQTSSSVGMG